MNKAEYIKFLEAVDVVCVNCIQLSEEKCKHCPVRMTYDALNEKMEKQKIEIVVGHRYIFNTTDLALREYNGMKVKIIRQLTKDDGINMYEAAFCDDDSDTYAVFEYELSL